MTEHSNALNMSEYDEIFAECRRIAVAKNADYGCETMYKFMEKGLVVRMNDKLERMINLVWNEREIRRQVLDEKVEDTAKDLINYACYLIMMKRGKLTYDK